jgi:hypothetical protein
MRSIIKLSALALFALALLPPGTVAAPKTATCASCHTDLSSLLPKSHVPVKGRDLAACIGCHKPDVSGKPTIEKFSSGLHRAHATAGKEVDCAVCHIARGKGPVAVAGAKVALPVTADGLKDLKPMMQSWAAPRFLDGLHGRASVDCGGCHASVPKAGDEVANERCLACHGPLDKLVAKTRPAQFPDRNPHESHLGPIACSVCHKGHEASSVYCLDCHQKFPMKIMGAG